MERENSNNNTRIVERVKIRNCFPSFSFNSLRSRLCNRYCSNNFLFSPDYSWFESDFSDYDEFDQSSYERTGWRFGRNDFQTNTDAQQYKPNEKSDHNNIEHTESCAGKNGFQVNMDVQHFQPNEISVKTIDDSVIVDAKHDERQDNHGFIKRQFTRRYQLPKGLKSEDVVSSLSSDGVLTVKAPANANCMVENNTRQIQIQPTGPARCNEKKIN